jgi:hypothetical protein
MTTYLIISFTTFTSLLLLVLSPPEKFYKSGRKWFKKLTWRAWIVILLMLGTMIFTLVNQSSQHKESILKDAQIITLVKSDSSIKKQLECFGLLFDSNTNRVLSRIDSSFKSDSIKAVQRPHIDICKDGIQVNFFNDTTISVYIPYCAVTDDNAYNVNIHSFVLFKVENNYVISNIEKEIFPEGIVITKELGKAIEYKLSPVSFSKIDSIYLFISGSYTNIDKSLTFTLVDIFKRSKITTKWVRILGNENLTLRNFLRTKGLL